MSYTIITTMGATYVTTQPIRVTTVINWIERRTLSTNGNPRFNLFTDHGMFQTQTDASLGYGIENLTNSRYPETFVIGNPENPEVTLVMTKANKVYSIEYKGKVLS